MNLRVNKPQFYKRLKRVHDGLLLALVTVVVLNLFNTPPVHAQNMASGKEWKNAQVKSFEQQDLDGDNIPDVSMIQAEYLSANDLVTVYDQANDNVWSENWQIGTDFINDVWIFQTNGAKNAQVIIRFEQAADPDTGQLLYRAHLYDDVDQDLQVLYRVDTQGIVNIIESQYPSFTVEADRPWFLDDGSINMVVRILMYSGLEEVVRVKVPFPDDGRLGGIRKLVDLDGDGQPNAEIGLLYPDIPLDWAFERTGMIYLPEGYDYPQFQGYFFFPYLGRLRLDSWDRGQTYRGVGDTFPPLIVDWATADIKGVSPFTPLWSQQRINFNSTDKITPYTTNILGFERFGHYLFTASDIPNLIVRWSMGQNDFASFVQVNSEKLYTYQVSMAWQRPEHAGSLIMDYKLEVAGIHPHPETTLDFGEFSVYEYPYDEWLERFTDKTWAYGVFISTEGNGYPTNETIYEWNTVEGAVYDVNTGARFKEASTLQTQYLFGYLDETPAYQYPHIREGFRGEYADMFYEEPAKLYFSPIDRRLHLYKATHGIFNLNTRYEIHYANLGGTTLNHWQVRSKTTQHIVKDLYTPAGYLLFQDTNAKRVRLLHTDVNPVMFYTTTPRNAYEWEAQSYLVAKYERPFAPDDLERMVDQFRLQGAGVTISNGSIDDFVWISDNHTRFVLTLNDGFTVEAAPSFTEWFDITRLGVGSHLVEIIDSTVHVQPLTPPSLVVLPERIQFDLYSDTTIPTSLTPIHVTIPIENTGLQSVKDARVQVFGGMQTEIALHETTVDILGHSEQAVSFVWTPGWGGDWRLIVRVETSPTDYLPGGVYTVDITHPITVQAMQPASVEEILSLRGEHPAGGVFLVFLIGAMGISAATLFALFMRYLLRDIHEIG